MVKCFILCLASMLALPVAPAVANVTDISTFGVVGDGVTSNTAAIQKAIDACSAKGGGTLVFPTGRYLTGTIQLKDNVTLRLDDQAVLLGSTNAVEYRNVDPFLSGDGVKFGEALIVAVDASHIGLEGPGSIDGQGSLLAKAEGKYTIRPFLIRWVRCTDVHEKDLHLSRPGAWTNVFFQCSHAVADHMVIRSRGLKNTDGIDVDSSDDVHVADCDIDSGDDAICLKTTSVKPCQDITISGCKLSTRTNAIKLGTESLGDFQRIHISNCEMKNIGFAGLAMFSEDGAALHDVGVDQITMDHVRVPLFIRLGARLRIFRDGQQNKPIGTIRDISISNVHATTITQIGLLLCGIPDHPIANLHLKNIDLQLPGGGKATDATTQLAEKEATYPEVNMFGNTMPGYAMYARHLSGVRLEDIHVWTEKADPRPAAVLLDVTGLEPADFSLAPR